MKVSYLHLAFIACSLLQTFNSKTMIPGRNFNTLQSKETHITINLIDDNSPTFPCIKSVTLPIKGIMLSQTFRNCLTTITNEEPLILFSSSISPSIFNVIIILLNALDTNPLTKITIEDNIIANLDCFNLQHLIPLLDAACYLDCQMLYDLIIFLTQAKIENLLFQKDNLDDVLAFTQKIETTHHNYPLFRHFQSCLKNKFSIESLATSQANFPVCPMAKVSTIMLNNGTLVALEKKTKSISATDFYSNKPLAHFGNTMGISNSIYMSGNGEKIASTTWDNSIKIWNFSTQQLYLEINIENCFFDSICLSHDGTYCASAKSGDTTISIWETATGSCINTITTHYPVNALCFVPQSLTLAIITNNHTIALIDSDNGECLKIFQGHTDTITALCFNTTNERLISSSRDNSIKIWNMANGTCLQTITSNQSLESVHCTPENTIVAITSSKGFLQAITLLNTDRSFTLSSLLFLDYMLEKEKMNAPINVHQKNIYKELYNTLPEAYKSSSGK